MNRVVIRALYYGAAAGFASWVSTGLATDERERLLVVAAILCGFALVGYVVERVAAPERDEDRRREDARLPRIRFDRVVACIGMAALNTAFVFAVVADPILFLTALFANIAAFAALAWLVRDREEPGTPSAPSAGRGEAT